MRLPKRALVALVPFLLAWTLTAASKTAAIDDWCLAIRGQFLEAAPQFFLGPDPWTQVKRLSEFPESGTLATIYYEGNNVRWLLITMQSQDDSWFETTDYFFDQQGLLQKRERYLDQYASHIRIREDQYFRNRKTIKTSYHHSVLRQGDPDIANQKEDWNAFFDPDAPVYLATSDLPPTFLQVDFRQLASLRKLSASPTVQSLLKFTRPANSRAEMSNQTMPSFESYLFADPGWHLN